MGLSLMCQKCLEDVKGACVHLVSSRLETYLCKLRATSISFRSFITSINNEEYRGCLQLCPAQRPGMPGPGGTKRRGLIDLNRFSICTTSTTNHLSSKLNRLSYKDREETDFEMK